jgi:O-antigen ligase
MPAPGYPLVTPHSHAMGATPHSRATAQRESAIHRLALALVAITVVAGGIVFSEPAPVDALTIGLIILLPTIGLIAVNPTLLGYMSLWAVAGAAAVFAATLSLDLTETLTHVSVTIYLYLASAVFAAFIAYSPIRHTELIFKAWTWGALVAAATALIGYFDLLPGAYELFTKFDRASGTFKDPNVLGPFLVAPTLYMVHVALTRSWHRMLPPLAVAAVLAVALLLTFSRGAWMNTAAALVIYGYLTMLTSDRASTRLKVIALLAAALIFTAGLVALAATSDSISNMIQERSNVAMSYDVGSEGRFGGQQKAIALIVENPLGIGAQEFATRHHSEEAHNVYLSVLLDAGWLGGGIYWILVGLTLVLGLRHALKPSLTRPLFLIAYSAFVANALEGLIVDTDHWRHFYLLMAIIWGLMSAAKVVEPMVRTGGPARRSPRVVTVESLVESPIRWPEPRRRLPNMLPRMLREST